jgi:hypothetical protein
MGAAPVAALDPHGLELRRVIQLAVSAGMLERQT